MTDVHTLEQRTYNMSRIKSKNTRPELEIRKLLYKRGFRYRLHRKELPGKPDLVFPKHKAVIFINGCFWHHHDCRLFKIPETRKAWWEKKLTKNKKRDKKNLSHLLHNGWRVMVIWECSFRGKKKIDSDKILQIVGIISKWLKGNRALKEIRGKQ
jgi:DNA mismatch endonuclease (patch repair protein)